MGATSHPTLPRPGVLAGKGELAFSFCCSMDKGTSSNCPALPEHSSLRESCTSAVLVGLGNRDGERGCHPQPEHREGQLPLLRGQQRSDQEWSSTAGTSWAPRLQGQKSWSPAQPRSLQFAPHGRVSDTGTIPPFVWVTGFGNRNDTMAFVISWLSYWLSFYTDNKYKLCFQEQWILKYISSLAQNWEKMRKLTCILRETTNLEEEKSTADFGNISQNTSGQNFHKVSEPWSQHLWCMYDDLLQISI